MQNQFRRIRRRPRTASLLKCQPPACQRILGGNNRQERMDAVSGREDRRHRADDAWARQQKKERAPFKDVRGGLVVRSGHGPPSGSRTGGWTSTSRVNSEEDIWKGWKKSNGRK